MKVVITEEQYRIIERLILEDKAINIIPKLVVGDLLLLTDANGNKLKFEVLKNDMGQVYVKNLDSGVYKNMILFFTKSDFRDNELNYRFIHKEKEADKMKESPSTWRGSSFKNISQIEVFDKAKKPKGSVDVSPPKSEPETKDTEDSNNKDEKGLEVDELVRELNGLKDGKRYIFELDDNSKLYFEVISKSANHTALELYKVEGDEGQRYNDLIGDNLEFEAKSSNVKLYTNDQYKFDMLLDRFIGGEEEGEEMKSKKEQVTIQGIVDFNDSSIDTDTIKDKDKKKGMFNDVDKLSNDEMIELIFDNPRLKKAFMSKPSFWDLILKRNPKGIITAKNILNKYFQRDYDRPEFEKSKQKEFINDFKINENVKFELTSQGFYKEIGGKRYILDVGEKYSAKVKNKSKTKVNLKATNSNIEVTLRYIVDPKKNTYNAMIIIPAKDGNDVVEKRTVKIYKKV